MVDPGVDDVTGDEGDGHGARGVGAGPGHGCGGGRTGLGRGYADAQQGNGREPGGGGPPWSAASHGGQLLIEGVVNQKRRQLPVLMGAFGLARGRHGVITTGRPARTRTQPTYRRGGPCPEVGGSGENGGHVARPSNTLPTARRLRGQAGPALRASLAELQDHLRGADAALTRLLGQWGSGSRRERRTYRPGPGEPGGAGTAHLRHRVRRPHHVVGLPVGGEHGGTRTDDPAGRTGRTGRSAAGRKWTADAQGRQSGCFLPHRRPRLPLRAWLRCARWTCGWNGATKSGSSISR